MKYPSQLLIVLLIALVSCVQKKQENQKSVLDFVDPMIGTGAHGHTFPGAVVPFGRVQLSPDTHLLGWEASSGYHYEDTVLYGFSHTHLSGTGIGDMGDILFLPFTDNIKGEKPVAKMSHEKEEASPGYYQINVAPWNVKAELTATKRTGWHRYSYPKEKQANLMIDLGHILQPNWGHKLLESHIEVVDQYTVQGYRKTSGWAKADPIWFVCKLSHPIKSYQLIADGKIVEQNQVEGIDTRAILNFDLGGEELIATVAISAVDMDGAVLNLSESSGYKNFDEVHKAARKDWEEELSAIQIKTNDADVLTNFYTALYHTKISPMECNDLDGRYRGIDQEIHKIENEQAYTVYSLWDVFRSWYPLMTIIDPARSKNWAYDLYEKSTQGGILPKWELNGNYTGTMVGYPAVSILSDAMSKGLIDTLSSEVLESAIKSSTWQQDFHDKHKGSRAEMAMPKHIYFKETMGFVPIDLCKESVSYGLEMAYYDWCIMQMAKQIGNKEVEAEYKQKANAYEHYFDTELKFMRGKKSDGTWAEDFNPRFSDHMKGEFVEGNSWQWTPFVLHDLEGLTQLMGGKKQMGDWLDELFTTSSEIVGENASSDITGLIGQYAHGNEPSHHVPFIYRYTDRPWRTEEIVDSVLYGFYKPTPDGIIGNEDCGQMSAWYVLNSIGLYQVCPGDNTFAISRPLVDEATIKVPGGVFTITVENNSRSNKYIKKVTLNGEEVKRNQIDYSDIKAGNHLKIFMAESY